MCGIAGIIKFHATKPAPWHTPEPGRGDFSALHAMSAAIAHRGPNGSGLFTDPRAEKTAALVHRRLAIIDIACGHQPMPNEDGTVHVVFNGEIYNHAELRRQLQTAGHRFATDHSDTEVLVHGWEEWGTDLPSKLVGMFAFALWDTRVDPTTTKPRDTLFLARDRLGQKPLFYASLDDGLVFGSTIPSVLAWPEVPRRVPREQIALYLQLGYIPPPQTIYRDISQVAPGHWIRLRGEVLDGGSYWSPKTKPQSSDDNIRFKLQAAVESQLIADVPIACFLSGGIDSSIVALFMQQAMQTRGGDRIHTVAVGFHESAFDETEYAAIVAKHIGSRHTRLEVNAGENILETLRMLLTQSLGQPFADSSILPTYHLSKAVRQIAPVALAGDGGDELFGGYDRYRAMQLLGRWGGIARYMPRASPMGSLAKKERYRRLAGAARESIKADRYTRLMEIFPPESLSELLGEASPYQPPQVADTLSPFRHGLLRDQAEYLPGDLLCKVDTASMSDALEVRAPFLDHAVVEAANALPDSQLYHAGESKYVLRRAFTADLPPDILTRPKKGFAAPIGDWFQGILREPLHDLLLNPNSFTTTHLQKPVVEKMLAEHNAGTRDHRHRLFAILMLELWWKDAGATLE